MSDNNPIGLCAVNTDLLYVTQNAFDISGTVQNIFSVEMEGPIEEFIQNMITQIVEAMFSKSASSTTNNAMQSSSNNMSAFWQNFMAATQGSRVATA